MALPLVHAAAGYVAYEMCRPAGAHRGGWLVAAMLLANAPDVDFLPGLVVGEPDAFHRGITHTLAAALMATVAAALWARCAGGAVGRTALLAAVAWGSHLVVDFVSADVVAPHGGPFLWPLSDGYWIAAEPLLREIVIDRSSRGGFVRSLFGAGTGAVWVEEIGVLVATVGGARLLEAARWSWSRAAATGVQVDR